MTTEMREAVAEMEGVRRDYIGRKIKYDGINSFRSGDVAEIVGWGLEPEHKRAVYFIRFDNGECDRTPAGKLFENSGFKFVD